MFSHNFFETYDLPRIDTPDGRYYRLPNGDEVPSVTTVLSRQDKDWLTAWKARVGKEKANRISTQAKRRGTAIHSICEKYLLNDPNYRKGSMPFNWSQFKEIKPYLDENVDNIRGIEHRLFSYDLRTAGTTDLICEWKGRAAIVDFKTSKYPKEDSDIGSYFVQLTGYGLMVKGLYGVDIEQIVVIMVVDHSPIQIFERNPENYLNEVYSLFKGNA